LKLKIKASDKRKSELYPPIGDQLDAIWKILKVVEGPEDAEEVRSKINKIKKQLHIYKGL